MTELEALREEARAWVAANFPTELAGRAPIMGQRDPEDLDAFETWKARLCAMQRPCISPAQTSSARQARCTCRCVVW